MSSVGASAAHQPTAVAPDQRAAATTRSLLLPPATALALLGASLLPLLTPQWIHGAIVASGGGAAGATLEQSLAYSDRTVSELLFGPATFAITGPNGGALYGVNEAAHLRDVRLVLYGFLALALGGAAVVGWSIARRPRDPLVWQGIARGGAIVIIGLLAVGAFAAVAFGVAFELFHRLLFPGGNWAFDPAQSNLVRLYPLGFWQLSAAAYGGLGVVGGTLAWWLGRRRARATATER